MISQLFMYNFRPGDSFKNFPQNGNPVSQADKAKMDSEVCTTHLPNKKMNELQHEMFYI